MRRRGELMARPLPLARSVGSWLRVWHGWLIPAVVAYGPLFVSSPGRVGADTKSYLYIDPGRLLRDARYLWDADVALGTVTHQTVGYLWPIGINNRTDAEVSIGSIGFSIGAIRD